MITKIRHYKDTSRYPFRPQSHSTQSINVRRAMQKTNVGEMRPFTHKCPKGSHAGHTPCGWSQIVMRTIHSDLPERWYKAIFDKEMDTYWIARIR